MYRQWFSGWNAGPALCAWRSGAAAVRLLPLIWMGKLVIIVALKIASLFNTGVYGFDRLFLIYIYRTCIVTYLIFSSCRFQVLN